MPSSTLTPSLWETVKCDFKSLFPEDVFQMWFEPVICVKTSGDGITLGVPSDFAAICIHDNYLDLQSVRIEDHLLVTVTDHTSLRKSELELQQTVKALERSNTNLEDFAHAASHDMKEPLRKILTFTDRLKTALTPRMTETERLMCERIVTSAERMQLLVDDLLEFSHISEEPRKMETIDLNEKIERVLYDLELPIEEKTSKVRHRSTPNTPGKQKAGTAVISQLNQ